MVVIEIFCWIWIVVWNKYENDMIILKRIKFCLNPSFLYDRKTINEIIVKRMHKQWFEILKKYNNNDLRNLDEIKKSEAKYNNTGWMTF